MTLAEYAKAGPEYSQEPLHPEARSRLGLSFRPRLSMRVQLAIAYIATLVEHGLRPLVGTVGNFYGNALAEAVSRPCKAELTYSHPTWVGLTEMGSPR